MKEESRGIKHLYRATVNSLKGLQIAFRSEHAFRQELLLVVLLIPFSFILAYDLVEWLLLIFPLFTLMITELLNSAIESAVDRVGNEFHKLSGAAKDMASAAVFINLVMISVTWGAFILRYFNLLHFGKLNPLDVV